MSKAWSETMRWLAAFFFFGLVLTGPAQAQSARETAIFAGGCFWCVESDFEHLEGVIAAESGYTGGALRNPTYQNHEGHVEAVRVTYDPRRVTYRQLLHHFWRHHDPLDAGGQFCDRGASYAPAIFVTETQRAEAERSKAETERVLGRAVVTPVRPATQFWSAEGYHQDYYRRNSVQYRFYRFRCGRDARVGEIWRGR
jgi:peptide-methionine (S)-S-oxide reductase